MPKLNLELYVIHWGYSAKGLPEFEAKEGLSSNLFDEKTIKFINKSEATRHLSNYSPGIEGRIITIRDALLLKNIDKK